MRRRSWRGTRVSAGFRCACWESSPGRCAAKASSRPTDRRVSRRARSSRSHRGRRRARSTRPVETGRWSCSRTCRASTAPRSRCAGWQLEYGAEIGRAVTNFKGPIVFVVDLPLSRRRVRGLLQDAERFARGRRRRRVVRLGDRRCAGGSGRLRAGGEHPRASRSSGGLRRRATCGGKRTRAAQVAGAAA